MSNTQSHFAMYRGALALLWADNKLSEDEHSKFMELLTQSIRLTPEQKAQLSNQAKEHTTLAEIWPQITDKLDRAHLINIAHMLFWRDGVFCHTEKEVLERLEKDHATTLDTKALEVDLSSMGAIAMSSWAQDEKNMVDSLSPRHRFFYYLEKKIEGLLFH